MIAGLKIAKALLQCFFYLSLPPAETIYLYEYILEFLNLFLMLPPRLVQGQGQVSANGQLHRYFSTTLLDK